MPEAVESSQSPAVDTEPKEAIAFDSLPLPAVVHDGIRNAGFTHCTPIQAAIRSAISGPSGSFRISWRSPG